jgi:16S rRNA (guanine527-N7)-methyltransferase
MQLEINKNRVFSQIKEFCKLDNNQIKNIEDYVLLLLSENNQHNFIGKSTVIDIWDRHILDCAQLLKFIEDKNIKFADFGSGAGLPGIILSILGLKEIHLVEKSYRKAELLRKAKLFSQNKVFVHQLKLEEIDNLSFGCIVSRALAPLDKLMIYLDKFLKKDGYALFLKGKNLPQEIELAKKIYDFDYELFPSLTSLESNIIKVSNIKLIKNLS